MDLGLSTNNGKMNLMIKGISSMFITSEKFRKLIQKEVDPSSGGIDISHS